MIPGLILKQPFAGLIASGRATIDIKTWSVDNYRGDILIVSNYEYSLDFGHLIESGLNLTLAGLNDPIFLLKGCAIAVAKLEAIKPIKINEIRKNGLKTTILEGFGSSIGKRYEELEASGFYLNGWYFTDIERIDPFPVRYAINGEEEEAFGLSMIQD